MFMYILLLLGGLLIWWAYVIFKSLKTKRNSDYSKEALKSDTKMAVIVLLIGLGLVVGGFSIGTGGFSSSSSITSSNGRNVCQVCGRSWPAGDSGGNYKSIARTHMCVNCYNNYKYAQESLGN